MRLRPAGRLWLQSRRAGGQGFVPARVRSRGCWRGRPRLVAAVLAAAVRCAHDCPGSVDGRRGLRQGHRCLARLLRAARISRALVGQGGGLGLVGHAARGGVGPAGRGRPALDIPALPLLFYFFYDDIEAVAGVLEGAGVPVVRTGHPPHALGGEVKVLDPDGNTVLLGQRERPASRRRPRTKGSSGSPSCGKPPRWCPRGAALRRPARSPAGTAGAARTRPR